MSQFVTASAVPSSSERIEAGRALRAQTPRAAHAEWQPPASRRDPIDKALARFAQAYAEQTVRDHARLAQAVDEGRLPAVLGR